MGGISLAEPPFGGLQRQEFHDNIPTPQQLDQNTLLYPTSNRSSSLSEAGSTLIDPDEAATNLLAEKEVISFDSMAPTHRAKYLPSDCSMDIDEPTDRSPQQLEVDKINNHQRLLFGSQAVEEQIQWFREAQTAQPVRFYSRLARVGIDILENGTCAETSLDRKAADFLVFDSDELEEWLLTGTGDKLVVLKDPTWFRRRPATDGTTALSRLRDQALQGKVMVDVQDLNTPYRGKSSNLVRLVEMKEVEERWGNRDRNIYPLNLLNLIYNEEGVSPWPVSAHCTLLNQALGGLPIDSSSTNGTAFAAGKPSKETVTRAIDIQSCLKFQIHGQAGAISNWHMDHIGPYTWVTLELNSTPEKEKALKLWAWIRTDDLSPEEREEVINQFKNEHQNFRPRPELIRVLCLESGDTLIMPPGTIHAPITITDCLFRGGMAMQKRMMKTHFKAWRFCMESPDCTNEDKPKQSRRVLDYCRVLAKKDPQSCGYDTIKEFEDDWKAIAGMSMTCRCDSGCVTKKCHCRMNSQRCGALCHGGVETCKNPFGCEASMYNK